MSDDWSWSEAYRTRTKMRNQIHCNAKKKLVNQSSDVLDIRATNIGGRLIGKTTARARHHYAIIIIINSIIHYQKTSQ